MDENKGIINRCWAKLKQPSDRYSLLALLIVGFFSGIIF